MANIVIPNTFSDTPANTNLIKAAEINANYAAVTGQVNGNLDNTNIKAGANIDGAKFGDASISLAKLTVLVLWGSVGGGTGAISNAGSGGWSSSRTGAGVYVLTFAPAFSAAPVILATPNFAGGALTALAAAISTSSVTINTNLITTGNPGQDSNFGFVAIGAR
jgi:hypothetical protein